MIDKEPEWEAEVTELLRRAQYERAVERLKDVPEDERLVQWHGLAIFAWQAAGSAAGVGRSDTAQALIRLLDRAIARFPESARFVFQKACLVMDESHLEGVRLLKVAREMAEANIERDKTGALTESERQLLDEVAIIEDGMAKRWRHEQ